MPTTTTSLQLDELLEYARQLAREQSIITLSRKVILKRQVKKDLRKLDVIHRDYLTQTADKTKLPLAGEWLLDNQYLLHEQYQYIQKNLPLSAFRRLPVLTSGQMKGYRRIYSILYALLKITKGNSDPEVLVSFLWAYQQVQPLTIGELWAVPLVLRFVIFHQLRNLYAEVNRYRIPVRQEILWNKKIAPLLKEEAPQLNSAILNTEKYMDLSNPSILTFLEHKFRRSAALNPLLHWLEARASAENHSLTQLKKDEQDIQAYYRMIAGNLFTGLQEINRISWDEHFEELSLVEQTLRQDPARIYPKMDFESRDMIRRELELTAREWRLPEIEVADKSLLLAQTAAKDSTRDDVEVHVGYFLLEHKGWEKLAKACHCKGRGLRQFRRVARSKPNLVYFPALAFIFLLFFTVLLWSLAALKSFTPWQLALISLFLIAPVGGWAVNLLHSVLMRVFPPHRLPKIEFGKEIPLAVSTMVVIPTMLTSMEDCRHLLRNLEVYYLANRDPRIYFALLTDYIDAPKKELPEDTMLLNATIEGIEALNQRYPHPKGRTSFFLLHRERRYNPQEGIWMGWERKRGKLTEFNSLLAGEEETSFTTIIGEREVFKQIRYVITLDSDTQLPREAAKRLIGTIAHPLNTPVIDAEKGIVVKGYGILQPKITVSNASANRTFFSLLHGDRSFLDLYSGATSNPYQDLFGRGIFTGKGIYDARVFDQLLRRRFPENAILSHDLLEGSFLRVGLVSDIELLDNYPSCFLNSSSRSHRWVRGDWQLLPWLKKNAPNQDRENAPLALPLVSRWQMIDDLRHSLLAPSLLFLIVFSLFILPGQTVSLQPVHWAILALLALGKGRKIRQSIRGGTPLTHYLCRDLFSLLILPYLAISMVDAIIRTLYRMNFSRRRLLEWVTSAEIGKRMPDTLWRTWEKMRQGRMLIVLGTLFVLAKKPATLPWLLPLSCFWLSAPFWVHITAAPRRPRGKKLNQEEKGYLREITRRTWHFFEEVVSASDNWLPPDNLQVNPDKGLAHRTSPTNIGLYLAAIVTARDFGYITTGQMIQKLNQTMDTLALLPRWQGHFYNWYDTVTLKPLLPLYVSTVDSGNLIVYLLTVKEALKEWRHHPWTMSLAQGLVDTAHWEQKKEKTTAKYGAYFAPYVTADLTLSEWYQLLQKAKKDWVATRSQAATVIDQQLEEMEWFFPWLAPLETEENLVLKRELVAAQDFSSVLAVADSFLPLYPEIEVPALVELLALSKDRISAFLGGVEHLIQRLEDLIVAHDFTPLYDRSRRLFAIGYNVSNQRLDSSFYNLLASEARQASFMAIALDQVPVKHWSAMSRTSTLVKRKPVLVSWTGTAFEYLMPLLVMTSHPNTMWERTYRLAVKSQIKYGKTKKIPWGVSESGYYTFDHHMNYQYRAFGIPDLALKQGLEKESVVSPYSTILAAMVAPKEAVANLYRLEAHAAYDEYGFYEALDFTPDRLPEKADHSVVKSYMAHHQGMSLLALGNLLHGNVMHRRFLADPRIESTDLLLHENIQAPTLVKTRKSVPSILSGFRYLREDGADVRFIESVDTPLPIASFLSNGRYLVMVSNSGGGFSQYDHLLLTNWEEDPIKDHYGTFFYIKNITDGQTWSPTLHPSRVHGEGASMDANMDKIVFTRSDGTIHTEMKICVAPDEMAEIRQITLKNFGPYPCTMEVTSLLEPVLAPKDAHQAHPAFSKLFIETEVELAAQALLAHRRTGDEKPSPWMVHGIHVDGTTLGPLEYETDRARFVGRGRSYRKPIVIEANQPLSGTTGAVLDPVLALRHRVELDSDETITFSFITGVAPSRADALALVGRLADPYQVEQAFELAYANSLTRLQEMRITVPQVYILQLLASQLVFYNYYRQQRDQVLPQNVKDQSTLWAYGLSGDLPIILVWLEDQQGKELATEILRAHQYWQRKGLGIDLVLLINNKEGYQQALHEEIQQLIQTFPGGHDLNHPGGVFLYSASTIPPADQILLETVARISLRSNGGSLLSQLRPVLKNTRQLPKPQRTQLPAPIAESYLLQESPEELLFFNGWGGFTPDGSEYVLQLRTKNLLPAPWSNVIANPNFGFTVSEAGGGFTWAHNSREFKLTPWSNDPVLDPAGEICYLREEETGMLWSMTALPIRDTKPYTVRHGQGYTVFEHNSQGINQTGRVFTPMDAPVKILSLTLQNTEDQERELSVTYYLEWVLGVNRAQNAPFIMTEYDQNSGALLARNVYQKDFPNHYGFLGIWTGGPENDRSWTGDRAEFIGRNRSLSFPAALEREKLSNRTGTRFNPCGAMQVKFYLPPCGERTVNILIGSASSKEQVKEYMKRYGRRTGVEAAYQGVKQYWSDLLDRVQVQTPDRAFDLLLNRWLLYQTVSCRLWARSAFYQAGGAYGFRDQLQDALALLHTRPGVARKQILRHAAHQYREGDVQHWWHEETGYGIRTRFSDDLLWLPYAASHYVKHTGDQRIWHQVIPFLESPPLEEGEDERYEQTRISTENGTLYEHCTRAIERSLHFGRHGLPLMGTGDWNDGMSRVGAEGVGESVWLGWFLYHVLQEFIPFIEDQGELEQAARYRAIGEKLSAALNEQAWDGQWYRRAYNDQGAPLGSITNLECQIDCIAQAWGVISGAADPDKALMAMRSVDDKLVLRENGSLICLLTPPFNKTEPTPGYIQAYPPGIRENGGQYTHGTIWTVIAWAKLGEGNKAYELFHILNPINHARTDNEVQRYRVEPYVMTADVYSVPPYVGRGGWSWYTGSAGWMYQAGLEWILGLQRRGTTLYLRPTIPEEWPEYTVNYRYGETNYEIKVENPQRKQTGGSFLSMDGLELENVEAGVPLVNDGGSHYIRFVL